MDTRPIPKPVEAKTELEVLIEKHKNDLSDYDIVPATIPPPTVYAHAPPGFMYPAPPYVPPAPYPSW
jgi:hypothetical protein